MKRKQIFTFIVIVVLFFMMAVPVGAYDFRDDRMADSPDAEALYSWEDKIVDSLRRLGSVSVEPDAVQAAKTAERTVEFERGVWTWWFTPDEFLGALAAGMEQTLPEHERSSWVVPVTGAAGTECAIVTADDGGGIVCAEPLNFLTYLFQSELIDKALSGLEFDSVYAVRVPQWYVSFLVAVRGDTESYIPFAASLRADWLRLENGKAYTVEELEPILRLYYEEENSAGPISGGGGGGGAATDSAGAGYTEAAVVSGCLILLVLAGLVVHRRRQTAE